MYYMVDMFIDPRFINLMHGASIKPAPASIRRALDNLERNELIDKLEVRGQVRYRLTDTGEAKLRNMADFKERAKNNWDGRWRTVFYDIPDDHSIKRDLLREFLRFHSFGKLQKSCWVSPYNCVVEVKNFCVNNRILKHICFQEGKIVTGIDDEDIVEKAWGMTALRKRYADLIKDAENFLKQIGGKKDADGVLDPYLELREEFIEIVRLDPILPKALTPDNWPRERAKRILGKAGRVTQGLLQ